ncbi:hypothetical protein HanPI659440_Chr13g0491221 [Helianthus annuus]|nr:hypothetical protein HanPI659440_Chr13g0491221 [Helianthus annuus]
MLERSTIYNIICNIMGWHGHNLATCPSSYSKKYSRSKNYNILFDHKITKY